MTHAEAYRELDADRDNVTRWFVHRDKELRRRARKTLKFPVTWWLDYTSPRKNRYLIGVTCTRRKYDDSYITLTLSLRREKRGFTVYVCNIWKETADKKMIILQHAFDRYAERAGVNKTGTDLIIHFFSHHLGGYDLNNQRLASRSVRYNGRRHHFMAVEEGILLGDIEDGIFIARTFITYDMSGGLQAKGFADARSKLRTIEEEVEYVLST